MAVNTIAYRSPIGLSVLLSSRAGSGMLGDGIGTLERFGDSNGGEGNANLLAAVPENHCPVSMSPENWDLCMAPVSSEDNQLLHFQGC